MPKRTNDFQGLIKLIYELTVPKGGIVTESGMVLDKDTGTFREVDILIEFKYGGHSFRVFVECRNHARKQTVEWIDGLIGRTKSFDANKIIAVSSKGFYNSAIQKAKVNNIETLTLEQANDLSWGDFPVELGLAVLSEEFYKLIDVFYKSGEEYLSMSELSLESQVQFNGENQGTLDNLIEQFFNNFAMPNIKNYKKVNFMNLFPTRVDIEKNLIVESEHNWPEVTVFDKNDNLVTFSKVKYVVLGTRTIADVKQEHKLFNDKIVSLGNYQDNESSKYNFVTIQDPDTKKIHFNWKRKK